MKRMTARILLPLAAAGVLAGLAGGVAAAAPATPAAAPAPAIWALPGLDLGSLLGPSVAAPTEVLAPVYGLITLIS
jgi:hypothetical protein